MSKIFKKKKKRREKRIFGIGWCLIDLCPFFAVDKETARHEDIKDYYEFGREIGRGGFSVVVEGAKKGTSERFAIKCIKKANVEKDDIKLLRREIQIMKQVDHPNILKLFEVFER